MRIIGSQSFELRQAGELYQSPNVISISIKTAIRKFVKVTHNFVFLNGVREFRFAPFRYSMTVDLIISLTLSTITKACCQRQGHRHHPILG